MNSDITLEARWQWQSAAKVISPFIFINIIYMDDTIFYATAQSEPLHVDHEYSWLKVRWAPQA